MNLVHNLLELITSSCKVPFFDRDLDNLRRSGLVFQILVLLVALGLAYVSLAQAGRGTAEKCYHKSPFYVIYHEKGKDEHIEIECGWSVMNTVIRVFISLLTLTFSATLVKSLWCPTRRLVSLACLVNLLVLIFGLFSVVIDLHAAWSSSSFCDSLDLTKTNNNIEDYSCEYTFYFFTCALDLILFVVLLFNVVLVGHYLRVEKEDSEMPAFDWDDEDMLPGESLYDEEDDYLASVHREVDDSRLSGGEDEDPFLDDDVDFSSPSASLASQEDNLLF